MRTSPRHRLLILGAVAAGLACALGLALAFFRRPLPPPVFHPIPAEAEPQAAPPAPPPSADDAALAEQAQAVLRTYCHRCHGENGAAEGGFNYILDREKLIARKKAIPGQAERSKLFRRMSEGEMPPEGENPRPTAADVAVVKRWIDAHLPAGAPPTPPRESLTEEAILTAILADVLQVDRRERRFLRYFSLAHLANAGLSDDEVQTYRHGLAKLVNSLSWGSRVVVPRAVDPGRTVFRIDVRDYQWDARLWDRMLEVYPYGIAPESPTGRACTGAIECPLPYLRADWFVATASRPPLYHDLLGLPTTDVKLEEQLRVDVARNIEQERVARAGFNGSGVSRNNRLIERHELSFGGAYWKSYDFADNLGRDNLFAHPFGPGRGENAFRQAGGEIIFNLPNGLQAYMLVNESGRRIDKGPTSIVSDPRRPDRAVENGLSCMSCHARGLIPKTDQVRAHAERNPQGFSTDEINAIKALYPPEQQFKALLEQDAKRFREAVERTGAQLGATEPIVTLALQFEAELDVQRAAAEAGCGPAELLRHIQDAPGLARSLGTLKVPGGTIQRQVFTDAFPEIIREVGTGRPFRKADVR
jgi:mono/diheme cytochrome c family protein